MMAICSKFGTRGTGVAVGDGEVVRVAVGGMGVRVAEGIGEGVGEGVAVADGIGDTQAVSKTKSRTNAEKRFIINLSSALFVRLARFGVS
jgi:hypothetical protein